MSKYTLHPSRRWGKRHRVNVVFPDGSGPFRGTLLTRWPNDMPKIRLDSGRVVYGYECWWLPVEGWATEPDRPRRPQLQIARILDVTVYWDGPMAGLCEVDGIERYFACTDESEDGRRTFGVYALSLEQRADLERRRIDFRRMVGDDFDSVKRSPDDPPVTPETQAEFYKLHPPETLPCPERLVHVGITEM